MAEKSQAAANVSNAAKAPPRPPLKTQNTDKDLDDYFVCIPLSSNKRTFAK